MERACVCLFVLVRECVLCAYGVCVSVYVCMCMVFLCMCVCVCVSEFVCTVYSECA